MDVPANLGMMPLEIQERFLLDLSPHVISDLCRPVQPLLPCSSETFWKKKYEKDFNEFRINLKVQTYRDRYFQIVYVMKPSNWFGYYANDEAILKNIIQKTAKPTASGFPLALQSTEETFDDHISAQTLADIIKEIPHSSFLYYSGKKFVIYRFLLAKNDPDYALQILKNLGLDRLMTTIDSVYNLLFYLTAGFYMKSKWVGPTFIKGKRIKVDELLEEAEASVLSSLNLEALRNLYGHPDRNNDHASLLVYAISGTVTKRFNINPQRLAFVARLSPVIISYLYAYYASIVKIIEDEKNRLEDIRRFGSVVRIGQPWTHHTNDYPPYVFVGLQEPNVELERELMEANELAYGEIIRKYISLFWQDHSPQT